MQWRRDAIQVRNFDALQNFDAHSSEFAKLV